MPTSSSCPTPPVFDHLPRNLAPDQAADLRTYLAHMPDPRHRRGVRHPPATILAITAAAVTAGARSFTAIAEWAADAPQHILATLGARFDPHHHRYRAPDEPTMRCVTQRLDADHIDTAWLASRDLHQQTTRRADDPHSYAPRSRSTANPCAAPSPAPAAPGST